MFERFVFFPTYFEITKLNKLVDFLFGRLCFVFVMRAIMAALPRSQHLRGLMNGVAVFQINAG